MSRFYEKDIDTTAMHFVCTGENDRPVTSSGPPEPKKKFHRLVVHYLLCPGSNGSQVHASGLCLGVFPYPVHHKAMPIDTAALPSP